MMPSIRRIIPGVMVRLVEQRDEALARLELATDMRAHYYANEVRGYNEQIERLEASTEALAAKRRELDEARR